MQCICAILSSVACLDLQNFQRYLTNSRIFLCVCVCVCVCIYIYIIQEISIIYIYIGGERERESKKIEHEMCVLISSTPFVCNISHSKKKSVKYNKKFSIGLHVEYLFFLSDFNKT
jgi:hypothetical protein